MCKAASRFIERLRGRLQCKNKPPTESEAAAGGEILPEEPRTDDVTEKPGEPAKPAKPANTDKPEGRQPLRGITGIQRQPAGTDNSADTQAAPSYVYQQQRRRRSPLWFLLLLAGSIGAILGYLAIRHDDPKMASMILLGGHILSVVSGLSLIIIFLILGLLETSDLYWLLFSDPAVMD